MKMKVKAIVFATAACAAMVGLAVPEPKNVPELMTTSKGEKVTTLEQWEKVRAPELFALFEREEYGRRPAAANERDRVSFDVYDVQGTERNLFLPVHGVHTEDEEARAGVRPCGQHQARHPRREEGAFVGVLAGRGNHRARLRDRRVPVRLRGGGQEGRWLLAGRLPRRAA